MGSKESLERPDLPTEDELLNDPHSYWIDPDTLEVGQAGPIPDDSFVFTTSLVTKDGLLTGKFNGFAYQGSFVLLRRQEVGVWLRELILKYVKQNDAFPSNVSVKRFTPKLILLYAPESISRVFSIYIPPSVIDKFDLQKRMKEEYESTQGQIPDIQQSKSKEVVFLGEWREDYEKAIEIGTEIAGKAFWQDRIRTVRCFASEPPNNVLYIIKTVFESPKMKEPTLKMLLQQAMWEVFKLDHFGYIDRLFGDFFLNVPVYSTLESARGMIEKELVSTVCDQIDRGGTTIGLDIEACLQYPEFVMRTDEILKLREEEMRDVKLFRMDIKDSFSEYQVDVSEIALTANGFEILRACGMRPYVRPHHSGFEKLHEAFGGEIPLSTETFKRPEKISPTLCKVILHELERLVFEDWRESGDEVAHF